MAVTMIPRIVAVLVALLAAPPAAARADADAPAEALRVMPYGDSITLGTGSSHGGGYRTTFWRRMQQAGVEVDLVGGGHDGPEGFDADHMAFDGSGVDKLSEAAHRKLRAYRPDVVLLLIGTNDSKHRPFVAVGWGVRFGVLLDRLLSESDRVIVATIPPTQYGRNEEGKLALNGAVRDEVERRRARGEKVALVDTFELLDVRGDLADHHHPNDAGYEKIGNAFADALLAMLAAEGTP